MRQLLVTLSPQLCAAMRASLARVQRTQKAMAAAEGGAAVEGGGAGAAATSAAEEMADQLLDQEAVARMLGGLPESLADVMTEQCPLVLPLRTLLLMLDAAMPRRFHEELRGRGEALRRARRGGREGAGHGGQSGSGGEADYSDSDGDGSGGGGDDFSASDSEEDEDNDDGEVGFDGGRGGGASRAPGAHELEQREVDFDRFASHYWPHLSAEKRRGLGCAAVWTEVQSVLKGSREAVRSARGRLGREEYAALAAK